jgi:hypothetical protein
MESLASASMGAVATTLLTLHYERKEIRQFPMTRRVKMERLPDLGSLCLRCEIEMERRGAHYFCPRCLNVEAG